MKEIRRDLRIKIKLVFNFYFYTNYINIDLVQEIRDKLNYESNLEFFGIILHNELIYSIVLNKNNC
jgi:hypothetical protein